MSSAADASDIENSTIAITYATPMSYRWNPML